MLDMESSDARFRIAAAKRMLYREGCDSGTGGQFSARVENEEALWISRFGEYFDESAPSTVVKLGYDLRVIGSGREVPPASFHAAIFQARPDVNAIVHTHSFHAASFSTTKRTIGMYHEQASIIFEDQALFEEDGLAPVADSRRVVDALGDKSVLLMRGHGVLVASKSIEVAAITAIVVETAARFHLTCEVAGGVECSVAEMLAIRDRYRAHYLPNMWEANLRRLRRTDSDLWLS